MNWIEVWYSVPWRKRERKISKDNGKKGKEEERKIIRKGKERKEKGRKGKKRIEMEWSGVEWSLRGIGKKEDLQWELDKN